MLITILIFKSPSPVQNWFLNTLNIFIFKISNFPKIKMRERHIEIKGSIDNVMIRLSIKWLFNFTSFRDLHLKRKLSQCMMMVYWYNAWVYQSFDYNQMSLWYYLIQSPLYLFFYQKHIIFNISQLNHLKLLKTL